MLRIVLPVIAAGTAATGGLGRGTIAAIYVCAVSAVYIGIAIEIVIVVDGDVVVSSPTATISPASTPGRAHGQPNAKRNCHARRIVTGRRIVNGRIRVHGRTVYDGGIIGWNVNDFGICLLNDNDLFRFHNFCFYFLLFRGFQVARVLSLLPHALNRVHHFGLLR
jgi:hypothetical protein